MALTRESHSLLTFDRKELQTVLLLAGIWAFILTFRLWGDGGTPDLSVGIPNLLFVFLGTVVVIAMHEFGHKIVGAFEGYHVRIEAFYPGWFVSLFVAVYSHGFLPVITPNLVETDARPDLRLGKFRKYDNPASEALIAVGGLAGSVVAIVVFKTLATMTGYALFDVIVLGAVLHAGYSLIPWEVINVIKLRFFQVAKSYTPGDGLHLFWYSVHAWVFAIVFIAVYGGIALVAGLASFLTVLIIAAISTWLFAKLMKS